MGAASIGTSTRTNPPPGRSWASRSCIRRRRPRRHPNRVIRASAVRPSITRDLGIGWVDVFVHAVRAACRTVMHDPLEELPIGVRILGLGPVVQMIRDAAEFQVAPDDAGVLQTGGELDVLVSPALD